MGNVKVANCRYFIDLSVRTEFNVTAVSFHEMWRE